MRGWASHFFSLHGFKAGLLILLSSSKLVVTDLFALKLFLHAVQLRTQPIVSVMWQYHMWIYIHIYIISIKPDFLVGFNFYWHWIWIRTVYILEYKSTVILNLLAHSSDVNLLTSFFFYYGGKFGVWWKLPISRTHGSWTVLFGLWLASVYTL